jgi:hypothetical protein
MSEEANKKQPAVPVDAPEAVNQQRGSKCETCGGLGELPPKDDDVLDPEPCPDCVDEIWRSEGERLLAEHEAATRASKLTPDEKLLEAEDDATGELSTWLWENRAKLIGSRLQRWASSWRPASEPPPLHKHGCSEWILATDGTRYMAERFYRHAGPDAGTWGGDSRGYLWEVTHWMPRPPFPESLRT